MIEYDEETGVGLVRHMQGTARRISRRIRQFVGGITASVSADDLQQAARFLPPAGLTSFRQMPVDAQRHSLNVLTTLQRAGWHDPDLAAAAAGLTFNAWVRTALVLMETLAPTLAARLTVDDAAGGWRYLLHVHLAHPRIGAHWADADGCSPLTCWLIAHHQDKTRQSAVLSNSPDGTNVGRTAGEKPGWSEDDESQQITEDRMRLLTALQWADSQN